jgi:hypothetical protein
MRAIRLRLISLSVLALAAFAATATTVLAFHATPDRLTDAEFWKLSADLSEPNGYFRSDNLLSNEMGFQTIIPALKTIVKPGVYMGVGPEQNFTYIAALQPKMVFITDIRRGNLQLHLMYKALFEMATDRADFVGMLFGKKRPDGLTAASSISDIFAKYDTEGVSEDVHAATWKRIVDHLTKAPHTLPLEKEELDGIQYVYDSFYNFGTAINYNSSSSNGGGRGGGGMATYESLMVTNDGAGHQISYLASNELFDYVKTLESRNLIVPVVGDFAGPKALRAVGAYIRDHGETVQAFYLSNVEDYLTGGLWQTFCNSVSTLPLTDTSTFIYGARPAGGGGMGGGLASWYRPIVEDVKQYNCKGY